MGFTPNLNGYNDLTPFRYWCSTVLPLVYDDTLSYYELLNKVVDYLNKTMEDVTLLGDDYERLVTFVNDYFDNLDVQEEINNKLDIFATDGTLTSLIEPFVRSQANPLVASSTSQMTNEDRIYLNSSDGTLYYYNGSKWVSSGLSYGNTDDTTNFRYRGNVINLGYTSFYECNKIGLYSYTAANLPSITDNPDGNNNGGMLLVFQPAATNQIFQFLFNTQSNYLWFRYASNPFTIFSKKEYNINDITNGYGYRGRVIENDRTTFYDCDNYGFYLFSTAELPSITDKPTKITTGGCLMVYRSAQTNVRLQLIYSSNGEVWFRIGTDNFRKIGGYSAITYKGQITDYNTNVDSVREVGYYGYSVNDIPNLTNLPTNMSNSGGVLINFTGGGTGTVPFRFIVTSSGYGYLWTSSHQEWVEIFKPDDGSTTDTVCYCLGDSITQGYYSANGEIAGVTSQNYPYYLSVYNKYAVTNYGVGGSGYLAKSTVKPPWVSDTNIRWNAKEVADNIDFANANLVTLAYGVNDWHYHQNIGTVNDSPNLGTTVASNMKYVIEKILTDNPECKIVVILPMNCSKYGGNFDNNWGLGTTLETSGTLQHVIDVEKEICEYYGIQYIDQSKTSVVNRFNIQTVLPDGIHPEQALYKQIGKNISKQIQFT